MRRPGDGPDAEAEAKRQKELHYLLWKESTEGETEEERRRRKGPRHIPAPKLPLPGHAESYNPPPEYLPTPVMKTMMMMAFLYVHIVIHSSVNPYPLPHNHQTTPRCPPTNHKPSQEEARAWEEMEPEERPRNFLPRKFDSLRQVIKLKLMATNNQSPLPPPL